MKSASKTILLLALAIIGLYSCGRLLMAPRSDQDGETAWQSSTLEPARVADNRAHQRWQPLGGDGAAAQPEPVRHVPVDGDGWQSLSVIGTVEDAAPGDVRQTALRDTDGFRPVTNPFSDSTTSRRSVRSLPAVDAEPQETERKTRRGSISSRLSSLPKIDVESEAATETPAGEPGQELSQFKSTRMTNPYAGHHAAPTPPAGQQQVASQAVEPVPSPSQSLSFEPRSRSLPPVSEEPIASNSTSLSNTRTSRQPVPPTLPFDQAAAMATAMQNALNDVAPEAVPGEETNSEVPAIPTLQAEGFATPETVVTKQPETGQAEDFAVDSPTEALAEVRAESGQFELPAVEPEVEIETPATESTGDFVADTTSSTKSDVDPVALGSEQNQSETADIGQPATSIVRITPIIEQRAMQRIAYGKSLARRGASYAARQEFIQALGLIADAHDVQSASRDYSARLARALRALSEADDFVAPDTEQQLNMDMAMILETHDSRLIDPQLAGQITPIQAMLTYYGYAQSQMAEAVMQSPAGAEALYSLGKVLAASTQLQASANPVNNVKAMVMYQSALSANPAHYRSANELGVLMARNGQWQKAQNLFLQSLQVREMRETWQNLATTHRQLGENQLAELAVTEMESMQGDSAPGTGPMDWATPEQFAENAAIPDETNAAAAQTAQAVEAEAESNEPRGLLRKLF